MFAMADARWRGGELRESFAVDSLQLGHAPTNRLFQTADSWVVVGCYSDREWQAAHRALGLEATTPFPAARCVLPRSPADDGALERAVAGLRTDDVLRRLVDAQVACAAPDPVPAELAETLLTEEHERLHVMVRYPHPFVGDLFEVGNMVRFSASDFVHANPSPGLGQHSTAILTELGFSPEEIACLYAEGTASDLSWKPVSEEADLAIGRKVPGPRGVDVEAPAPAAGRRTAGN
jgi:crotonobetainyl-CoA:carnitine CoA-transferase CaiB-like acyl-CoA transferase